MHSADYAVADVRLPVCPSHAGIVSKRLNISSIFLPSGRHTVLVFQHQTIWKYSDGTLVTGASNNYNFIRHHMVAKNIVN